MGKVWKMPAAPPKVVMKPATIDFVSGSEGAEVFFKVAGSKSLQENLLLLPQAAMDAAAYELVEIAHEIILDAQENYCPFDIGNLKASGDSDEYKPGQTGNTNVAMWFGGEVTADALAHGVVDVRKYALEQHENLTFKHTIGEAKYLEKPFLKVQSTIAPRVAKRVAEVLDERGGTITNPAFISFALSD